MLGILSRLGKVINTAALQVTEGDVSPFVTTS